MLALNISCAHARDPAHYCKFISKMLMLLLLLSSGHQIVRHARKYCSCTTGVLSKRNSCSTRITVGSQELLVEVVPEDSFVEDGAETMVGNCQLRQLT